MSAPDSPAAARGFAPAAVRVIRRRIERWIATRTSRLTGPWTVDRRRVYILPTRYGWGYAALLLTMLIGAINYGNSLAFALTFLLAGLGLVAMHHTHANLLGLRLHGAHAAAVFAGGRAQFVVEVENLSSATRYALHAAWQDQGRAGEKIGHEHATADVQARDRTALALPLDAPRRGRLAAPRFALSTRFPLGFFRAWTWIALEMDCIVYPRPTPQGERLADRGAGEGRHSGSRNGEGDFAGLRSYRHGDPPASIHWKSAARERVPLVKQFAQMQAEELWLDWAALPASWDTERRLSHLARRVLDSDASGQSWGLRLPGRSLGPSRGAAYRHECLEALALFEGL